MEAGREFIRRLNDRIDRGENVVVESTLAGKSLVHYIDRAGSAGYDTALNFVFLDSADTCVARVRHRVRRGGHNVPEDDIRRRYRRRLRNFWDIFRFSVDRWILHHNANEDYLAVAYGSMDNSVVYNTAAFDMFLHEATGEKS